MPRQGKGLSRGGYGRKSMRKQGTNNTQQATRRDAAAAAAAERAALLSSQHKACVESSQHKACVESHVTRPTKKLKQVHTSPREEALKRSTIQFFFQQMGCPAEALWEGDGGAIRAIRDAMHLPVGQKHIRTIRRTLKAIVDGEPDVNAADLSRGGSHDDRTLLTRGEALIAADCLASGYGQWQAMHTINAWRAKTGKAPVSRTAVRNAVFALGVKRYRRCGQKTGNTDMDSTWAKARLAQAMQIKAQLFGSGGSDRNAAHRPPPISLSQVFWWDEKHSKCKLGKSSKNEYLLPVDENGEYCAPENGGQIPKRNPTTVPKFPQEARKSFGVMMKAVDGKLTGFKAKPFDYTGKKLVGVAKFKQRKKSELRRVAELRNAPWGNYCRETAATLEGGRFQMRYPDTWQEELRKECAKTHQGLEALVCVTDLINHVIAEGDKLFAQTLFASNWVIFHDALSQWWEAGAQAHLAARGFPKSRQICAQSDTNAETRYENGLVGDSPECDPLDSNLFSDFEYGMKQHVAITAELAHDSPNRFKLGTPNELSSTMERTWEVCPTPERIVQDISRFPQALNAIISARGAKVPELDNRRGRRATQKFVSHSDCKEAEQLKEAKWMRLDV